jgi:N6-adenosine-specific RNA methylase IME4
MKFTCIICDPPWSFSDSLTMNSVRRGASSQYDTMDTNAISNLPIEKLADPEGAILALWCPSSMLDDGLKILKAWGFTLKQSYIWIKVKKEPLKDLADLVKPILKEGLTKLIPNTIAQYKNISNVLGFGMGHLFRQTHEICLIGINNNKIYKQLQDRSQRSVCFAENAGHSIKPHNLHESLEKMFQETNKLEIFGRQNRKGWTVIGNQAPDTMGEDISISIDRLRTECAA